MKTNKKYVVKPKYNRVSSAFELARGIDDLVAQVATGVDGIYFYLLFNKKENCYMAVRSLKEEEMDLADLSRLSSSFVEVHETEEERSQREAIEHLAAAAEKLGYKLTKR